MSVLTGLWLVLYVNIIHEELYYYLILFANLSVGNIAHISIPNQGHQIGVADPELQGYEIEIDQLGNWPEFVETGQ